MASSSRLQTYGPSALVTGAASGIGAAFARRLAREGIKPVLVDRSEAGLEATAAACRASGVTPEILVADLTDADTVARVAARGAEADVGLVVHSAGITSMGDFHALPLAPQLAAVDLHCRTSLALAHTAGAAMRARGRGGIVLLSSNSAVLRAPYIANYAATKAYTLALAEALYEELRGDGVHVLALVPGMTDTPLFSASQPDAGRVKGLVQTPDVVVEGALEAIGRTPVYISSAPDRFAASLFGALLPRKLSLTMARRSMEYFYPHLRGPRGR